MNDFINIMDGLNSLKNNSDNKAEIYQKTFEYINRLLYDDNNKNQVHINNQINEIIKKLDENYIISNLSIKEQFIYYRYLSPVTLLQTKAPKILIYNWLPFDNPWNLGGGVTVYCKNIIEEMLKSNPELNIYFLSSGFTYNSETTKTFIQKTDNIFGDRVQQYEVVNSPVPAEQRNLYINPLVALQNPKLKKIISDFIKDFGEFQAVHFNNIEGLSLDVLDLKLEYPNTKFIFSIHNYIPVCVNGSYYMRHKHCNCNPKHTSTDCFKCTRSDIKSNIADETYRRGFLGTKAENRIPKDEWIKSFNFEQLDINAPKDKMTDFAKTATEKINKNCDAVLAVSKRVYEIAAENGFDKNKMYVSYIGTKVAEKQIKCSKSEAKDGLKIVFLGNDIHYEEKGYPFLLNSLSKLDIKYASKIDLILTVKQPAQEQIKQKLKNFRSVTVIQGYTHSDLEQIFDGCNLSLVPVLWEDNLPQISIESVAYGVPVLASSSGGACELSDSELFKFESGNSDDMLNKIIHFLENPKDLNQYWTYHNGLVTMSEHCQKLLKFYGLPDEHKTIKFSYDEYKLLLKEIIFLRANINLEENNFVSNKKIQELERRLKEAEIKNEEFRSNPSLINKAKRFYKQYGFRKTVIRFWQKLFKGGEYIDK